MYQMNYYTFLCSMTDCVNKTVLDSINYTIGNTQYILQTYSDHTILCMEISTKRVHDIDGYENIIPNVEYICNPLHIPEELLMKLKFNIFLVKEI